MRRGFAFLGLLALFLLAGAAGGGELNKVEQGRVNDAIDKGIKFLRDTQLPVGTWARDDKYPVGYAALPGLTLLESGVPANDPAIKKIAALIRRCAAIYDGPLKMEGTYEIALSILFLDRLGDPDDKKIIQTLALRLVAGQSGTGGWHYKCPLLGQADEKDLLTTLQRLPILSALDLGTSQSGTGSSPEPIQIKVALPFFGSVSYKALPSQVPPGAVSESSGSSFGETGSDPEKVTGEVAPALKMALSRPTWQHYCIKTLELPPAPADVARAADDKTKPPVKTVFIPQRLRGLPVFFDPKRIIQIENPEAKPDNSNTQFAILALWAAQRYDVPMDRTLRLLVQRFQLSQHPTGGSWGYHFVLGGNPSESAQMTAVGLLGLAVGHGLAAPVPGAALRRKVNDPSILKGFVALSRSIGTPTGHMEGHAQPSLYFMWSLERVAVLYNLELIGNKDWYRWGAEILVANQAPAGNWQKGEYPGSTPVLDTCLALLFLQRTNLAKDLGDKLPFNPAELNTAVADQARKDAEKVVAANDPTETAKPPRSPEPPPMMTPSVMPPVMPEPKPVADDTKPTKLEPEKTPPPGPSSPSQPSAPTAVPEEKGSLWPYIVLGLGVLLLLGAGVFLTLHLRGGEDEEIPKVKKKPAKKGVKR